MTALELQENLLRNANLQSSDIQRIRSHMRAPGGLSVSDHAQGPAFSEVLKALTQRNAGVSANVNATRTQDPRGVNSRSFSANLASQNAAPSASAANDTDTNESTAVDENAPILPDLNSADARAMLRGVLNGNAEDIPDDLLKALTDENGDFSDSLLDLILQDEEEEAAPDYTSVENASDTLNNILSDASQAHELLMTSSGRDLISALAENSFAGIITST